MRKSPRKPGHLATEHVKPFPLPSPVRRVERDVLGDLALPAIAVREQALRVVIELLARLRCGFNIRARHDGVDGAGFLAKAAIDALHHIDIVARGSARSIIAS